MTIQVPIPDNVHEYDSINYQLTAEELEAAYREQKHQYDVEDVSMVLSELLEDNDLTEEEKKPYELMIQAYAVLDAIAYRKDLIEEMENSHSGSFSWRDCADKAIEDMTQIVAQFISDLKKYAKGDTL